MTTRSYSDLSDSATTFDPEEQFDREIDERMKGMSDGLWKYSVICCGNCAFWPLGGYQYDYRGAEPLGTCGPGTDGSLSECRRHAPNATDQDKYPNKTAAWPSTARNDYCGDFEARG